MSRSTTRSTPKLPPNSAWAKGPPHRSHAALDATHPRRPGAIGQGVSIKHGVAIPRNPVKQGTLDPILLPRPVRPSNLSHQGSPVAFKFDPIAAAIVPISSPPTAAPAAQPVHPKLDRRSVDKLFQGPTRFVNPPDSTSLPSQTYGTRTYRDWSHPFLYPVTPIAPNVVHQDQNSNYFPPWPRPMANAQSNSFGVSGCQCPQCPQDGFGGPSVGPAPTLVRLVHKLPTYDNEISTPIPLPSIREHVPTSPLASSYNLRGERLSDHVQEISTNDSQQFVSVDERVACVDDHFATVDDQVIDVYNRAQGPTIQTVPTSPPHAASLTALPFLGSGNSSASPAAAAPAPTLVHELTTDEQSYVNNIITPIPPSYTQEHVPASPPAPPDKLLSDYVQESTTDDKQCVNRISTPPSSTQEHVPTLPPALTPPEQLHPSDPTLSCWIKNMNKLSSLIDRLQDLASSAPAEYQSQLSRQVVALRATFKKQQEHFMEFLQLSEEYANKYLLDISAEIEQQSSFLEKLEGRLEAANKLRGEAFELQILYESGTVASMENLRATGKASSCRLKSRNIDTLILALPRPLPEDHALFSEVDSVLIEIRRCYMEMDRFWTEEISRAIEALKMRRVDPTDLERWKNFHANLKHAIDHWKV